MISVVLIILNEQAVIANAMESVKDLADEIVVVDSGSRDETLEIAKKYGAKIYFRKFDNFANQKNWAVSKAKGGWILSLDADEQIPDNLSGEIKKSIKNSQFNGFYIGRINFILGGEIKHSRWSPDEHIWLWKKDKGKWVGEVHEEVEVSGRVGRLKNKKLHYQVETVSEFIKKNDFYASVLSKSLFKNGIKFSILHFFYDPIFEFFLRYIYKFGFLDGLRGFILAYLMAIFKLSLWIKIYELQFSTRLKQKSK